MDAIRASHSEADGGAPSPLPGFHGMVGASAPMQALFRELAVLGPTSAPVLILGESGTGKELVAQALHAVSPRRAERFEAVNCGDFSRELLRAELCGYEAGAYTGASTRQKGILRETAGGTVFLDEIAELPRELQAMLLRVLATGQVRPLGAARALTVDVRLLAATNGPLGPAIDRGEFRADLLYRLASGVLIVPPLRDRLEDLPLLVEHVRRELNAARGLAVAGVTPAALARLAARPWPGNVRELEAALTASMMRRPTGWLDAADLVFPAAVALAYGVEARAPAAPATRPPEAGRAAGADYPRAPAPDLEARSRPERCRALALEIATRHGVVKRGGLARAAHISGEHARRTLLGLATEGVLQRRGAGRSTRYVPTSPVAPEPDRARRRVAPAAGQAAQEA